MKSYKTEVKTCTKKTGDESCTCWGNANLTAMADIIKDCDVSKEITKMTAQHKLCSGNFSACKSTEDKAGEYIYTCSLTVAELTAKAAQVNANKEALTSAKTTITQLAVNSTDRGIHYFKQSQLSCAEIIALSAQLLTLASEKITSSALVALATQIANATGVSCSSTEQSALAGQVTSYTIVIVQATSVLTTYTSSVSDSSGSEPTDAELEAALINSTTNETNEGSSSTTGSGVTGDSVVSTVAGVTESAGGSTGGGGSDLSTESGATGGSTVTTAAEGTEGLAESTAGRATSVTEGESTSDTGTTKEKEITESTMLSPVSMGSVSIDGTGSMVPMTP